MDKDTKWRVVNVWNGGALGRRVEFVSTKSGAAGHNECFQWIHDNTPFSFHEATTRQGYRVEPVAEEADAIMAQLVDPGAQMLAFFAVELRNEAQGGVRPATLGSAWDSAQQAPDDVLAEWAGVKDAATGVFRRDAFLQELQWIVQEKGADTPLAQFVTQ